MENNDLGTDMMTDAQQRKAAKAFAAYWKDKGYEKGESQAFWLSLLRDVDSFREKILLSDNNYDDRIIGMRRGLSRYHLRILRCFPMPRSFSRYICWSIKTIRLFVKNSGWHIHRFLSGSVVV